MKNFVRRSLLLFAATGAALILTGAGHVMTGSTGSANMSTTSNPASGLTDSGAGRRATGPHSGVTSSMTSSTTPSVVTRPAASVISGPSITPVILSPYAEELARIINFDRQVLVMVKEETHERIQRMVGYDEDGYQIIAPGIAVSVPEDRSDTILAALRHKLAHLHYMAFVVEVNAGYKIDKIGVLKGTDQYDILRVMHTDGDEYDISNQDVIDRLKEWEKISSFDIIGADYDWVEIEFRKLPKDLKSFAEEVYDFSPDAVDEGPGTVDGLIREISKTHRLFLLWD
jgi:hypothetical protein